jgi:hypothetical protein
MHCHLELLFFFGSLSLFTLPSSLLGLIPAPANQYTANSLSDASLEVRALH